MTIYAKLLRLPFFQGIDRDELEAMASKIRFDFQKYDEGAWIARENDRCATLTLVMTGRVEAEDRKSTRLNSSHYRSSRMPSSA